MLNNALPFALGWVVAPDILSSSNILLLRPTMRARERQWWRRNGGCDDLGRTAVVI